MDEQTAADLAEEIADRFPGRRERIATAVLAGMWAGHRCYRCHVQDHADMGELAVEAGIALEKWLNMVGEEKKEEKG